MMLRGRASEDGTPAAVTGIARPDRRTKHLVQRIAPGEIAIIDHKDLDRVAAETLVEAKVAAVVNAAPSVSGRYPNVGPLVVVAAGIPLIDAVGTDVMLLVEDGTLVSVVDDEVRVGEDVVGVGERQTMESLERKIAAARSQIGDELERFAQNTLNYIQQEAHLLVDEPDVPDIPVRFRGRHVLVVVRGIGYKDDLEALRRSGYLQEMKPLLVGVDGGADALREIGYQPDVIIGDMDSVSEQTLRSGATLVVHGYADPAEPTPGAGRLDDLGLEYATFRSAGTSEDIAMLMAFEQGAELIVAVGTHSSMVEFLDKGRPGMASTFLVRMRVGPILVDAKGVSKLYETRVRKRDLLFLVLAAFFTLVVITIISDPVRLVLRGFLLPFK